MTFDLSDELMQNALVEGVPIHVRQLIDFF
jgi:hypothetical protein